MIDYSRERSKLTVDYLAARETLKEEAQRALEKSEPDQSRAILADLGLQLDAVDRKYFADQQDLYNKYIEEFKATAYGKLNIFSTSSFASYTDRRKNLGLDSGGQSTSDQVTRQTYGPGNKNKESAPTYGISNAQKEYFKAVEQTGQSISTNPFARRVQKDNQARLINNLSNVSADTTATLGRVSDVPGYQPAPVEGATSLDPDPEESTNLDEGYVRRRSRKKTVLPYTFLLPANPFSATTPRTLAVDDTLGFSDQYYVGLETGPLASVVDGSIFKPRDSGINPNTFLTLLANSTPDYPAEVLEYRAEMSFIVYGSLVPYVDISFDFAVQFPGGNDVVYMAVNYDDSAASPGSYRETITVRHGTDLILNREVEVVDITRPLSLQKVNQWRTLSVEFSGLNVIAKIDDSEIGKYTYNETPVLQAITNVPGCEIAMTYVQGGGVGGAVDLGMRNCNFEFL